MQAGFVLIVHEKTGHFSKNSGCPKLPENMGMSREIRDV